METKRALVCTHTMPEFDREGGSRRVFHFLEFLRWGGWTVSFAAENGRGGERYARTLQQMGIATYTLINPWHGGREAVIKFERLIGTAQFDLVLFAFWTCAENYTARVRQLSPGSIVVVDSVDIHFLRESRRVFCDPNSNGHSQTLSAEYAERMRRELNAYAASDAVFTVSTKEADLVNDLMGRSLAFAIPDTEDADISPVTPSDRRGMLFVGNFRHPPNAHAVEYLCENIVPQLPSESLARHPIQIVGNDPTEAVLESCAQHENVQLIGWVPSVVPYLERARVSLVPLRYGAGTKRKLMQSLMTGTPSVSTSVGIEGLNLGHNLHLLVADDDALFAASIIRLLEDDELWRRLAEQGRKFIQSVHGRETVLERFSVVLGQITNRLVNQPIFWEELQDDPISEFDSVLDESLCRSVLRGGRYGGFCNIAGAETDFTVKSENMREDIVSTVSSSINRHRQLVCALSVALFNHPNATLATIADCLRRQSRKTYIAEKHSVLWRFLREHLDPDLLVSSEYFGSNYDSGKLVGDTLHQDLEASSFRDAEFDVVITQDVFEHIPDAIAAETEVMRILKPGGVYCFSVPFLPYENHDLILAARKSDGSIDHLADPQYHEDPVRPDEGVLVYRIFSFSDMKKRFESSGHQFKSFRFWSKPLGILGDNGWVHIVRKRNSAASSGADAGLWGMEHADGGRGFPSTAGTHADPDSSRRDPS